MLKFVSRAKLNDWSCSNRHSYMFFALEVSVHGTDLIMVTENEKHVASH